MTSGELEHSERTAARCRAGYELAAIRIEETMRHCAFSHVFAVHRGTQYIYRVLGPERATLSLLKRGGSPPPFYVVKLGDARMGVDLSWQEIAGIAAETYPPGDRSRIALEAAARLSGRKTKP